MDTTVTKKDEATSITRIDEKWMKENSKVGIEGIAQADLPIPRLSLVQKSTEKAILSDGKIAEFGTFYYSATKEALTSVDCVLLGVKAETKLKYKRNPESKKEEDYEKVWTFLGVRSSDMKPFVFSCRGTSAGAARNFVGNVVASGYPMFSYKVRLESKYINGDKGAFYVLVFRDLGVLEDKAKLLILKELAEKYNVGKVVDGIEEDENEVQTVTVSEPVVTPRVDIPVSETDDIPF